MNEGVGLRHVVDYFYIVSALTKKNEVVTLLRRFGLMRFAAAMMYVHEGGMRNAFGEVSMRS